MAWSDFDGSGPSGSWIPGDRFAQDQITQIGENFKQLKELQYKGTGDPEGVVTAPVSSIYRRIDGAAGTTLYVKESGVSNTGWRAFGVIPPVVFKTATVVLTDAQTKALVTTDIDLIAAPASGYRNRVVSASVKIDTTNGGYTNVNSTSSYLVLTVNGIEISARLLTLSSSSITFLTDLLTGTAIKVFDWPVPCDPITRGVSNLGAATDHDAKPVKIHAFNNRSGNFTGGNSLNSLRVTLSYYEELL